jgi:hypothetical protein
MRIGHVAVEQFVNTGDENSGMSYRNIQDEYLFSNVVTYADTLPAH